MKPKSVKKVKNVKKVKVVKKGHCLKNKWGTELYVGDYVRLTPKAFVSHDPMPATFAGRPITRARIVSLLRKERSVQLDRKLGGYWTWSVDEVSPVKGAKHG